MPAADSPGGEEDGGDGIMTPGVQISSQLDLGFIASWILEKA
jgi:hypothetical protein